MVSLASAFLAYTGLDGVPGVDTHFDRTRGVTLSFSSIHSFSLYLAACKHPFRFQASYTTFIFTLAYYIPTITSMFTMLLVVLLFFIWILFLTFLALFVARTLSLEYFRLGCWYISHLFSNVTRDTILNILFQRHVVFTRDCTPCFISLQKREYCWINLFVLRFFVVSDILPQSDSVWHLFSVLSYVIIISLLSFFIYVYIFL